MSDLVVQNVESLDFDLEYDGPSLASHEMDVRDLAPALLSAADLFQTLNRRINPLGRDVQINIRATSEGSFLIQLKLAWDVYSDTFTNPGLIATEGLIGLFGAAIGILVFLRKRGRAGEPVAAVPVQDGMVRLEWPDGTTLEVPADVPRLAEDSAVRASLARLVAPVATAGIDSLHVLRGGDIVSEVESEDVPSFFAEDVDPTDIISDSTREVELSIVLSAWQVGRKWRFSDGRGAFWAAILDPEFNLRITQGERFGSHDILKCRVREVQWRDASGLHVEISVLELLDRREGPEQLQLGDGHAR